MKATLTTDKRITSKSSRSEGIINYDSDNAYPQRVEDIINSSSVASLCHDLALKFTVGDSFKDSDSNSKVLNGNGLTLKSLLRKVTSDLLKYNGYAVHVNYNANYEIVDYNYIPFEYIRLTSNDSDHPGKLAIYDDWQKVNGRVKKEDIEYIDFFNSSPNVIEKQVLEAEGWEDYKGQIYYYSKNGKSYPLSPVDSVLEDMQTDCKTKLFKYRNVSTNFMASHFLEVDEFESEDDRAEFEDVLTEFQGADDALKIMLLEKKGGDEASFNLQKVDIQGVDRLYEYTESSVRDSIIRNYLIPPVLLLQTAGKLGSSKEIQEAANYYNTIVRYNQSIIEESFIDLFKNNIRVEKEDFTIVQLTYGSEITKDYFPYASEAEIRSSVGLKVYEVEDTEDKEPEVKLYQELGVGGIQALTGILADPVLSQTQKLSALQIIFGIGYEEALDLVGI
jgi:hypothetical protein